MSSNRLAALIAHIGRHQAHMELKWMSQALLQDLSCKQDLTTMLDRRTRGEPLQYILGTQPFGPLNLLVRSPVLIPRPETEHWTIQLSELLSPTLQRPVSLLDLGTGSGCIPLLLCHLWPLGSIRAHGIDVSPDAIQLAKDNAARCGVPAHGDLCHGDRHQNVFKPELASYLSPTFLDLIKPPFDIVTSNPPYISPDEYLALPSSVKDYEDRNALVGGADGLEFYRAIARLVSHKGMLTSDAVVVLEVGDGQADQVQEIMRSSGGLSKTDVWLDPWGKRRTVVARM